MKDTDLAWVAGLLEGEGCFYLETIRGKYHYPHVAVGMTDEDVVRRLHAITGVGVVRFRPRTKKHHKDIWLWDVRSTDARKLMRLVLPLMGQRRSSRIMEVLGA